MDLTERDTGKAVSLVDLTSDPYPIYAELRRRQPVAWVPAANRFLVTRYNDIVALERQPEIFSAVEERSLVIRVMGHPMLRKDGAAHRRERAACEPALRPSAVGQRWVPAFHRIVNSLIDAFIEDGEADLFDRFAAPCAALSLAAMLGLRGVNQADLREWSQAMMDGTGNYADDPAIWTRSDAAAASVDAALREIVPYLQSNPDGSIISSMLHADDPLSFDEIRANVKVIIGGGLNEPRDAIATGAVALLQNPDQLAMVEADPKLWKSVFEETIRWISPIGMYPRQTTTTVELGGTMLPPGSRIGVVLASGNRDEAVFPNASAFDITRRKNHIAFGGGPHFCLGAWAARSQVGEVALPTLFARLHGLRLSDSEDVRFAGWVFRGPLNLPCRWDQRRS